MILADMLDTLMKTRPAMSRPRGGFSDLWGDVQRENHRLLHQVATLEVQVKKLTAENERLRLQEALRPVAVAVEVPAQRIVVQSEINQTILGLIAQTGLSRSWRIIEQVLRLGKATNRGSVQNALTALTNEGLLEDLEWQGQRPGWKPATGRARRLVVLTERGKAWARAAYGKEPVCTELHAEFIRHHDSLAHATGILEAADHLRAAGYRVELDPAPLLAGDERWGRRSEPDLLAFKAEQCWAVEVQREVHERRTEQWNKALEIEGRLMLVVFTESKCAQQAAILHAARRRRELVAGVILLTSLEAMETGKWQWREL